MADYLLIFLAAVTGSAHCVAMCGGFSLGLVRGGDAAQSSQARLTYHAGKIFTYLFLGALAGTLGIVLQGSARFLNVQQALSIVAGVLLIFTGLQTLHVVPSFNLLPRVSTALWVGPTMGPLLGTFRNPQNVMGPFYLGLFNGFLPCGLVYAFTFKAATTGSLAAGMMTMVAFGLGTVPALLALGMSGVWLAPKVQQRMMLVSGGLVLVLGVILVLRGLGYAPHWLTFNAFTQLQMQAYDFYCGVTNR